ncbi:hypothetical protein LZP85_08455 [Priestia flexa]|uniref:hypothetical protein n=1 Tax=Priestia flexa TaxID=86664 RepID=UPI001CD6EAC8|nr:hypothetical protein [Priestia flexa]MCA0966780.1 hypothetical protein [Priestia flexa]UIR31791.1 hypothetical protein LZP85_08455 [Priestia flexa]
MAQIVMLGLFIGPWLLFFFFDSNRIKRYVLAGLFGIVMRTISLKWLNAMIGGKLTKRCFS